MALREIRILGDDLLRKKSREVEIVDDRIKELINDMIETMIKSEGVGLAAPQIGILKRIVIVMDGDKIIPLVNPPKIERCYVTTYLETKDMLPIIDELSKLRDLGYMFDAKTFEEYESWNKAQK